MFLNVLYACFIGFFLGMMFVRPEGTNLFIVAVVSVLFHAIVFLMVRFMMDTKKALVTTGITLSVMVSTIGLALIGQVVVGKYHNDPVFHAKVNAYVFMDARYQAQLDSEWFEKRRSRIARYTLYVQGMRSMCGDPVHYRQVVGTYNRVIDEYNTVIVSSMVGSQYAEPVKQLLVPQFNDQLVPCGAVFKPI